MLWSENTYIGWLHFCRVNFIRFGTSIACRFVDQIHQTMVFGYLQFLVRFEATVTKELYYLQKIHVIFRQFQLTMVIFQQK